MSRILFDLIQMISQFSITEVCSYFRIHIVPIFDINGF